VLTTSGELGGAIAYAQAVRGTRPDTTVIDRRGLADGAWLERALVQGGFAALARDEAAGWRSRPARSRSDEAPVLLARLIDRALPARGALWEPGDDAPPSGALVPDVPLERLAASPQPLPAARPLVDRVAALAAEAPTADGSRRAADALARLGWDYLAQGDLQRAASLFDGALARVPGNAQQLGLAEVKARRGDLRGALATAAPLADQGSRPALLAAGRYRLELGDLRGAERDFAGARTGARDAPALVGLAEVAHARGDDGRARALVEEALAVAPADAAARDLAHRLGD
jgi:tetratricopeptide (TPR) repeat protein